MIQALLSIRGRARCGRLGVIVPLAGLLLLVSGCARLSRIQVFTVSMLNDTDSEVVLRDCDSFCSSAPLTFDLQPGQSVDVHRTTNMHKYFSITTPTGGHVGCLDLYFKLPQPGASVPVSQAIPCPAGSRVPWKTIAFVLLALLAIGALLVHRHSVRSDRHVRASR